MKDKKDRKAFTPIPEKDTSIQIGNKKKQDDFLEKAKDMLDHLSDSVRALDKKYGGNQGLENREDKSEETQKHILFDFIPEDFCMNLLKYLQQNYQGSSIKELSKKFNLDLATMQDYIEILLYYGLVIEMNFKKEKLYSLHEGTYSRFILELKGDKVLYK